MTVGELCDLLGKMDPKLRVVAWCEDAGPEGSESISMEVLGVARHEAAVVDVANGRRGYRFGRAEHSTPLVVIDLTADL